MCKVLISEASIAPFEVPRFDLAPSSSHQALCSLAVARSGSTCSVVDGHTVRRDLDRHTARLDWEIPCLDDLVIAIPLRSYAGCHLRCLTGQSVIEELARALVVGHSRSLLDVK